MYKIVHVVVYWFISFGTKASIHIIKMYSVGSVLSAEGFTEMWK